MQRSVDPRLPGQLAEIEDCVFSRLRPGRKPRVANMLVEDHLRPAAIAAGLLKKEDTVRFGFHNLRRSLAAFLVAAGRDPKTVQGMLRHSNVHSTLQLYAHGRSRDRLDAQGEMLDAFFAPSATVVQEGSRLHKG